MKKLILAVLLSTQIISTYKPLGSQEPAAYSTLETHISNKWEKPLPLVKDIVSTSKVLASQVPFPQHLDVLAIVAIESEFNPYARSNKGAKGLGQILYKKARFDITSNLEDTVNLLALYKKKFGSTEAAIMAYNVGETSYRKGVRNPNYLAKFKKAKKELTQYV